jgi:helicase
MLRAIGTARGVGRLLRYSFIDGLEPTTRSRAVARHFLTPPEAFEILAALERDTAPFDLVAELELREADG